MPVTKRVHDVLNVEIPPAKPVIGERAYEHESGMHAAAMLRAPETYEAFDPATYGGRRELRFGGDTGRGAVCALLADHDVDPDDETVADGLEAIRNAAAERDRPLTEAEARQVLAEAIEP